MEEPSATEAEQASDAAIDRRARLMAIASIVVLVGGIIALYAFIQTRGSSEPEVPMMSAAQDLATLSDEAPQTGEIAPDFTIDMLDGTEFSLSDHLATDGRPLYLNLWASWCFPCRAEMPVIDEAAMRNPGVYFLGVSVRDNPAAAEDFVREIGVTYPIALDRDDQVADGYPVLGMPATFLVSPEGVIVRTLYGELTAGRIDAELATYFGG